MSAIRWGLAALALAACTEPPPAPLAGPDAPTLADGPQIQGRIGEVVQQIQRRATWVPGQGWVQTAGGVRAIYDGRATLEDRNGDAWALTMEWTGYGRGTDLATVPSAEVSAWDDRVTLERGTLSEWYLSTDDGVEQGFTLDEPPPGLGEVTLKLELTGDLEPELRPGAVWLTDPAGETRLVADALVVTDATDAELPARFDLDCSDTGCDLLVRFDDAGAEWPVTVDPLFNTPQAFPTPYSQGTAAGWSVDIGDDRAIVGIPGDLSGTDAVVAILARNQTDADAWGVETYLDEPGVAGYGAAVAIDNGVAVVGAPGAGQAYLYEFDGDDWSSTATELGSGAEPSFGSVVDLDAELVAVGAPDHQGHGAVFLYPRYSIPDPWLEWEVLQSASITSGDRFGAALQVNEDNLVVGAPGEDAAYLFGRGYDDGDPSTVFAEFAMLQGEPDSGFGTSVAWADTRVAIGAPLQDGDGAVSLYTTSGFDEPAHEAFDLLTPTPDATAFGTHVATDGSAVVVGTLTTSPAGPGGRAWIYEQTATGTPQATATVDTVGADTEVPRVALRDGHLIVGSPQSALGVGETQVLRREGDTWEAIVALDAEIGSAVGSAVAIEGDVAAIGLPKDDTLVANSGRVIQLQKEGGSLTNWILVRVLENPNEGAFDRFGQVLAMDAQRLVVASPYDNTNAPDNGIVHVYEPALDDPPTPPTPTTPPTQTLTSDSMVGGENFGWSVALDKDRLVVGEPGHNGDQGRAHHYVFTASGWVPNPGSATVTPATERCGEAVALSHPWMAVGSPRHTEAMAANAGTFTVYDLRDTSLATSHTETGSVADHFLGTSLAFAGDTLFVGAPGADGGGSVRGEVQPYTYTATGPTWNAGTPLTDTLTDNDQEAKVLATSADRLLVGTELGERVVLRERNALGEDTWGVVAVFEAPEGPVVGEGFGRAVDIDNDRLIIGAPDFESGDGRVVLSVLDADLPPVAIEDAFDDVEDAGPLFDGQNVLANDFDGNLLDTLEAFVVDTPVPEGSFVLDPAGSFSWDPGSDWNGETSFTYHVKANGKFSNTATVNLTVSPVNDAPVAVADTFYPREDEVFDSPHSVLDNDTDVDGDLMKAVQVGLGTMQGGTVDLNEDGTFSYTNSATFQGGIDSFDYTACEASGVACSSSVTVTLDVEPVNDAPVGTDWGGEVDEDTPLVVGAPGLLDGATDEEDDSSELTAQWVSGPSNGTLTAFSQDGSFTYSPSLDYHGVDSFTFNVVDLEGGVSNEYTATITVNPVNDLPVPIEDQYIIDEDTTLQTFAGGDPAGLLDNDTDVDADDLEAAGIEAPSFGTLTTPIQSDGSFLFDPGANNNGEATFNYQVDDQNGGVVQGSVTITVRAVPDAPTGADWDGGTDEDTPLVVAAPGLLDQASDADGDTITAVKVSEPGHGSVIVNANGSFTYTPDPDYADADTPDSFTFRIEDATGLTSDDLTASIEVTPENDAPVAVDDAYAMDEDSPIGTIAPGVRDNDVDPDNDASELEVTVVGMPDHGAVTMYLDGSFDYVPDPDFTGVDVFTYEVKDPDDLTDQATVTITVSPVNDAPVATDDAYDVTDPGGAVVAQSNGLLSNDSDADGDPLTAILVSAPTTGLLNLATDGSFDYVPAAHFDGVETFTYEVSDGLLVSDVATVEMRVFVAWDTADTGGTTAPTDTGCPATTWFVDADGDGFGNDDMTFDACDQPLGTTDIGGDCDDSLASAFPGADEIASDGVDQDCDGADAGVAGTGTEGCGCDATGASWSAWSLGLLVLAFRRRGRPIC